MAEVLHKLLDAGHMVGDTVVNGEVFAWSPDQYRVKTRVTQGSGISWTVHFRLFAVDPLSGQEVQLQVQNVGGVAENFFSIPPAKTVYPDGFLRMQIELSGSGGNNATATMSIWGCA